MDDLNRFAGAWQIMRRITDNLGQQGGRFVGQAVLEPDAQGGLIYDETGQLHLSSGPVLTAQRRYLWGFEDGRVVMRFADGRPFHDFAPKGQSGDIRHLCGDDIYDVRYDFTRFPSWTARWQVTGPRKDYVSFSTYSRV